MGSWWQWRFRSHQHILGWGQDSECHIIKQVQLTSLKDAEILGLEWIQSGNPGHLRREQEENKAKWIRKWKQAAPGALGEFQKARSRDTTKCHREIKRDEDWDQNCWVCRILELNFKFIISIDRISQTILCFQMTSQHFAKIFCYLYWLRKICPIFQRSCSFLTYGHICSYWRLAEAYAKNLHFRKRGREVFFISIKKCMLTTRLDNSELSCLCVILRSTSLILI